MKNIQDFNVQNKKVLVRCDFNVPIDEKGNVLEDFRIKKTLPTIRYLIENKAKVIVISHLGDPPSSLPPLSLPLSFSLRPVSAKLAELLGQPVLFASDCVGREAEESAGKMKAGDILLLENLRFHSGEKDNDDIFASQLARLADIYINDGFSVCHRPHASVAAITRFLPSAAGLLLQSEVKILAGLLEKPARPLTVLIGGVKIATKALLIEKFLEKADNVLLGGKVANTLISAKGLSISVDPELGDDLIQGLAKIDLANPRLHLPVDGLIALKTLQEDYLRIGSLGSARSEEAVFDIGPEAIKLFSRIIKESQTIFWSGPMGLVEDKRFAAGSLAVASAIIESSAFSVAGGGDTTGFLEAYNLIDKFSYVSTGGGAMLEFLSGKKLPGLEALR